MWSKFLSALLRAFDSVDVDGSGLIEWLEFVFSFMNEDAKNYGTLADMEKLKGLLEGRAYV